MAIAFCKPYLQKNMNKEQIKSLQELVLIIWADRAVSKEIYEKAVNLLGSAMYDEEFTLFLENLPKL